MNIINFKETLENHDEDFLMKPECPHKNVKMGVEDGKARIKLILKDKLKK